MQTSSINVEEEDCQKHSLKYLPRLMRLQVREDRMSRLEIEVEERRREADDRYEDLVMTFLAGLMQSVVGGYASPPFEQGGCQTPSQPDYPQAE